MITWAGPLIVIGFIVMLVSLGIGIKEVEEKLDEALKLLKGENRE